MHGITPVGSAQLGQSMPALTRAFGGDPSSWQQVGTPWIAARSLTKPRETLAAAPSASWLLSTAPVRT
jgi:hypothetical protein